MLNNLTSRFSHSDEGKNRRRTRVNSGLCRSDLIVQLFMFNLFLTITKFGEVPDDVKTLIEQTDDADQLDAWMDALFDVDTLDEMPFDVA